MLSESISHVQEKMTIIVSWFPCNYTISMRMSSSLSSITTSPNKINWNSSVLLRQSSFWWWETCLGRSLTLTTYHSSSTIQLSSTYGATTVRKSWCWKGLPTQTYSNKKSSTLTRRLWRNLRTYSTWFSKMFKSIMISKHTWT